MAKQLLLVVAACTLLGAAANSTVVTTPAESVYEMMERYGFPGAILPREVTGHVLRPDGSFTVTLPGYECRLPMHENVTVAYGNPVAGVIRARSISRLTGVAMNVKKENEWLSATSVDRDGDKVRFLLVGGATKSLGPDDFIIIRRCGRPSGH